MNKTILNLIIAGGSLLAVVIMVFLIFNTGSKYGQSIVNERWNQEKIKQEQVISQLKDKNKQLESEYRLTIEGIRSELQTTKKEYEVQLSNIESEYINRLQSSETRASVYKRKAESGTDQCRNLADITTELDRSIEQGRRVVKELSTTLRQRDREITLIGNELFTVHEFCK